MDQRHKHGVFNPKGHVVICFPSTQSAGAAARALSAIGLGRDAVRHYSDREMVEQIDHDIALGGASAVADPAHEQRQAQRGLALMGYHWLIVHAPDAELAVNVAELAAQHGAARAQSHPTTG